MLIPNYLLLSFILYYVFILYYIIIFSLKKYKKRIGEIFYTRKRCDKKRKSLFPQHNFTVWKIYIKEETSIKSSKSLDVIDIFSNISTTKEKNHIFSKSEKPRDLSGNFLVTLFLIYNRESSTYGKAAIVASLTKISRRTVREMLYGCGGINLYLLQKAAGCSRYPCFTSERSLLFAIIRTGILLSAKYFCKSIHTFILKIVKSI